MKRGDFVVYAMGGDVVFGRISKVEGKCLTIIPACNDKHRQVRRVASNVISADFLLERLTTLDKIN